MISIGRGIRWYNDYKTEVDFCIENGFEFMQLWFKDGTILVNDILEPKEKYLKEIGFPVIIHAVFDPEDFEKYGDSLLEIVEYLEMNEVIVHPVCEKKPVDDATENQLALQVKIFSEKARNKGILWYLENNSVVDTFHYKKEDLKVVYQSDSYVEQLLDVAHIDNYQHLKEIIDVKFPKCLHVAGKHFDVPHEHLSLMEGDIDYKKVFQDYLKGYQGRVILEVDGSDEELIHSKKIIEDAIKCRF